MAVISLQTYEAVSRSPQLARSRALIAHTFEVMETAEQLRSTAQNAERAQRGYLLSAAPAFLKYYQDRIAECRKLLVRLRQLTADNPDQQRRMPVLEMALEDWITERDRTVEVHDSQGFAAAQQLVRSRAGMDTLRSVNAVLDTAIAAERDLLVAREQRATEGETRVRNVAIASALIDVVLLASGILLTLGVFRRAREFERQRQQTERQMGEQLLQTQEALAQTQKMEALGHLTGGVAHDFNNLLHVIKNAITIVQVRLRSDDPEVTKYLEMVKRNTDRAASTTARLLAFARRHPLDPKPTDLNRLVPSMAELLRNSLGEDVSMEVVLGSGLWPIALDSSQLEIALLNLAVNARDAMPHSGKLTIETSNAYLDEAYARVHSEVAPGQYAMLAVSDTGVGMSAESVARAVEPFFTTKEAGQGTGLGLSQVFGFVKQSGGHLKIYSEIGQGTTVKMYFPRLIGVQLEDAPQVSLPDGGGSGESILVVEDNDDVRAFTAQLLTGLGYRVTAVADGRQALKALERLSAVDLLFTDVGLPGGMSGKQLASEAQRRQPGLKVLYTTGYARNSIVHHGRLDSGVDLITKPFTQSDLAAKILSALRKDAAKTSSES